MAGLTTVKIGGLQADCIDGTKVADNAINSEHINDSAALPDGVTATTQSASDGSTKVATTAYVDNALSGGSSGDSITEGNTTVECVDTGSDGHITFDTEGSERMRIHNGGVVSISNGIELGSGLDATAANTLDDYEEGTWTPTISNNGFTYTYSTQEGVYTKIGRLVTLRFRIVVTARSGSSSGGHSIINLPMNTDGLNDGGSFNYAMPSELIVHKAGTSASSGTITLLFGGFANSATTFFWVNNPTSSTADPFDLGADFNLGGVITYTSNN